MPGEFFTDTPLRGMRERIAGAVAATSVGATVERWILSAYGGWLSAEGSWPTANVDWTHRAAMGRDYHVRVLRRGALFPSATEPFSWR